MTAISVWILGDQLLGAHPALTWAESHVGRGDITVLLIESVKRVARLPYQRKKIVLMFSAMRHYADSLREQGYMVDLVRADTFEDGLRDHVARHTPQQIATMASSEYYGRERQIALGSKLNMPVTVLPNTQFLVEQYNPTPSPIADKLYVMENFYRDLRRHFGILVERDGSPMGGVWNFDKENRKPLPANIIPLTIQSFTPDAITQAVIDEVAQLPGGVGTLDSFDLAVTRTNALAALHDFIEHRLPLFGDYEDAMSTQHHTLFHSMLSPYVNIGLLEPLEMVRAAVSAYERGVAPINAVEGFVRQTMGWREFMYWQYWRQMPDLWRANSWNAHRAMPQMFWDAQTSMNCIHHVVSRLIDTGYTHHIERLMIICNFCLLAGIDPAEVAEWFLIFYFDAYEWVVLPNVIGMGLNADGGKTATKPYIASANYINKMSDYCKGCVFNPKKRIGKDACPYNALYWNFVLEHEQKIRANPRLGKYVLGAANFDPVERDLIQRQAAEFLEGLVLYE